MLFWEQAEEFMIHYYTILSQKYQHPLLIVSGLHYTSDNFLCYTECILSYCNVKGR